MPSYKLFYFNARGRAEPARILFAYVGQEYEDVRYSQEEWAKHKAATPLQQLPYLEVDGLPVPQSGAILGFLSRQFDLNGANNEETTKIEIVLFTLEDLFQPLGAIFHEKDEARKKKLQEEYKTEKAPKYLKGLEDFLKANGGGDGYFVGSKISQADIFFFATMEMIRQDEVLKKFPKLVALRDRIAKEPKIAAHLEKRPKTEFYSERLATIE